MIADYYASLKAPVKEVIWFEESAHYSWFEESERFNSILEKKLLALSSRQVLK
jgi:pimeloyl-ACP methyl ester carboxylesterase